MGAVCLVSSPWSHDAHDFASWEGLPDPFSVETEVETATL